MHTTLRSVLTSPLLREGRPEVLSGQERLDIPVRWVHVAEVADLGGLLSGGEIVLSTGLPMSGSTGEAVDYLRTLVEAGAAGLVVELGERFPAVPAAVVEAAREARFPVVALHRRVRFVEVTEQVHRGIVSEQLEQVELAREVHERFTRLSLEEADAAAIVAAAAALAGSSVVLEDLSRHVVSFEAHGRPAAGLLADWERRSRSVPVSEETGVAGPEGWVTTPVGMPGRRWGRLVVPDPQTSQQRLAMVMERAAQALELGRMVERDRLGLERQAHGGFLADLAAGRVDEELAGARAASLGLARTRSYVAAVARAVDRSSRGPGHADGVAAQDRSRELAEQVAAALRTSGVNGLVGPLHGGQTGLLLAVPLRRGEADVTAALDVLTTRLPANVVLGVGPGASSLVVAGAGLPQAAHVAEVAATMPRRDGRRWFRSSDVRLRGLMALLADDPRVQAFVEAELSPLLEREASEGGGLLDLLREYVRAGGNKTRLAEASHRSRAGVYKQLDKLERVLGVDLDDPLSLMSLGVALLAHDTGRSPTPL